MHQVTTIELKRDCQVVQIPGGNTVGLPAGTAVDITQTLGGTFTIRTHGGLFRLGTQDADALGLEAAAPAVPANTAVSEGPADEKLIWDTLKTCYDPEIPVNIVDLGLVYDMHIEALPSGNSLVSVKMTLTAPGCGMGATIAGDAQQKLLYLPGIEEAVVEIVWDPPWHQSMITEQGRKVLGLE
jgi:probable FeS assembly SUF system protein SufT